MMDFQGSIRALLLFLIFPFFFNHVAWSQNQAAENSASIEDILIIKTSAGIVEKAEGWFHFQVSSFRPILVVKVNGFAQMVKQGTDWAEFKMPYFLKPGKNLFSIFVQTQKSQHQQNFFVTYNKEKSNKKDAPPLSGVLSLGQTRSDNMQHANEGSVKKSANKNDLLFSLAYLFPMNQKSILSINGVLKFDHQQNRELASEEVLFRSFSFDYVNQDLLGFNFNTGMGQSVISIKATDAENPRKIGEFTKDLQSLYVFLGGKIKWANSIEISSNLQLDNQDKIGSNSEDGMLNLFSLGGKYKGSLLKFGSQIHTRSTKFKDVVKDYDSTTIDADVGFVFTPWLLKLSFQNMDQKYKIVDPANLLKLHNQKDTLALSHKYIYSYAFLFDFVLKNIKQESNDVNRTYNEKQTTIQLIMLF